VAVIGFGLTKFGKHEESVIQLLSRASLDALRDSRTEEEEFDAVFVANMGSGEFEGKTGIHNALIGDLALEPAFGSKIENTSGSGGTAFLQGWLSVASGQSDVVLVAGGEKMTSVSTERATEIIATLTHEEEFKQGVTLLSFAGMTARYYMERYGAPREAIAKVAVKNHRNGVLNPNAQFQKATDGAAALVLAPFERARSYTDRVVKVSGVAGASDTHVVHERDDLASLKAVKLAGEAAYKMARKTPADIQVAELHDMYTLNEIIQSEDLGFFVKGKGWKALEEGLTEREGRLPINTSGGLKSKGHPIGATGVAQVAEITQQLQGRCGARQVKADVGLACNVAGFGNSAVVSILEKGLK